MDQLLNPKFDFDNIKAHYLTHTISKIRQFSDNYHSDNDRMDFVNYILKLLSETESKISDLRFSDEFSRIEIITQIRETLKQIFKDLKINDRRELSTNEKIILLEYLGILKFLEDKGITQKDISKIFELLLERSFDNIKTAIRNRNGKIKKTGSVKNENSLNTVKEVIDRINLRKLIDCVNIDLDELNKTK